MDLTQTRGILLDFDGTLIDSELLHFEANSRVFAAAGHTIDEAEYYLHWSLLGEGAEGEIARHQLTDLNPLELKKKSREIFLGLIASEPPPLLPGARELLTELPKRGYLTVIASNTPANIIEKMLKHAEFPASDIPIIGARPGLRGKPAPDIFLAAREYLGMPGNQCLIVEDTVKGLRSAIAANIPCALVRYFRYPEFDHSDANLFVDSLEELLEWLPGVASNQV